MNEAKKNTKAPMVSAREDDRRGTIIILVLAVLAVLSLVAVSYVSFTQLERDRARAAATDPTTTAWGQISAVNRRVGQLLAADLFGNKIVDETVPRVGLTDENDVARPIWPRMFEDGEYYDAPNVDFHWATGTDTPSELSSQQGRRLRVRLDPRAGRLIERVGPEDDAWLASTEPEWELNVRDTRLIHQVSNLRSALRWTPRDFQGIEGEWVREDGAFVDLAAMVENPLPGNRPNAGVDLSAEGLAAGLRGEAGFRQEVWDIPMSEFSSREYGVSDMGTGATLVDEREWADTDGDGRPDARWQELDVLNNASSGLIWLVATRVVDASAFANINSALEFPLKRFTTRNISSRVPDADAIGTGETPADIDVYRLLTAEFNRPESTNYLMWNQTGSRAQNAFRYRVDLEPLLGLGVDPRETPYVQHLEEGLGVWAANGSDLWLVSGGITDSLTQEERRRFWERSGSLRPGEVSQGRGRGYSLRELIDLRGFNGTNNGEAFGVFAQRIDGPVQEGLYPTTPPKNPGARVGPLRSGADPSEVRNPGGGLPTGEAIFLDTARHLTTVSGESLQFGPVPAVNDDPSFWNRTSLPRIRFAELARENGRDELAQRVFDTVMYYLAPLAVDQSFKVGVPEDGYDDLAITTKARYFYGGWDSGPASKWLERYVNEARNDAPTSTQEPANLQRFPASSADARATYAVLRALSFAANLFDANDRDSAPTVMRFYPTVYPKDADRIGSYQTLTTTGVNRAATAELEVDTRLAFGDIRFEGEADDDALHHEIVGFYDGQGNPRLSELSGVSAIGVEEFPVLREVHTWALYQGNPDPAWSPGGDTTLGQIVGEEPDPTAPPRIAPPVTITPSELEDQAGSIVAFEFANPWPNEVSLKNYTVRLQNSNDRFLEFDLGGIGGSGTLAAGEVGIVYWHSGTPAEGGYFTGPGGVSIGFPLAFEDFVTKWRAQVDARVGSSNVFELPHGVENTTALRGAWDPNELSGFYPNRRDYLVDRFGVASDGTPPGTIPPQTINRQRVIFQGIENQAVSVLLLRDSLVAPEGVLVDRITDAANLPGPAIGTQVGFPGGADSNAVISGPNNHRGDPAADLADRFETKRGNFRVVAFGRIARESERPAGDPRTGGFPPYMIERPEANTSALLPDSRNSYAPTGSLNEGAEEFTQANQWSQAWDFQYPVDGSGNPLFDQLEAGNVREGPEILESVIFRDQFSTMDETGKGGNGVFAPVFQLFVPDEPLKHRVDLQMVSAFAGLYFHGNNPNVAYPTPTGEPDLSFGRYSLERAHLFKAKGPGAWLPLSQQLASVEEAWSDVSGVQVTSAPSFPTTETEDNKYFGVLNPLRYGFGEQGNVPNLNIVSDERAWDWAVPPVTRMLDAFDALNPADGAFANGRVNINTATLRVLEALPMMEPIAPVLNPDGTVGSTVNIARADLVRAIRDRGEGEVNGVTFDFEGDTQQGRLQGQRFTGIPGFRYPVGEDGGQSATTHLTHPTVEFRRGFTNVGEVGLLAEWFGVGTVDGLKGDQRLVAAPGSRPPIFAPAFGMGEAALDFSGSVPIDSGVKPFESILEYSSEVTSPANDYEERAGIFRPLSNVISTRSDVYIVTYVLRAFDPDRIESIDLGQYGDPVLALEDPAFQPVFETRRMVVFDRSNVLSPSDEPRILMDVPLPPVE